MGFKKEGEEIFFDARKAKLYAAMPTAYMSPTSSEFVRQMNPVQSYELKAGMFIKIVDESTWSMGHSSQTVEQKLFGKIMDYDKSTGAMTLLSMPIPLSARDCSFMDFKQIQAHYDRPVGVIMVKVAPEREIDIKRRQEKQEELLKEKLAERCVERGKTPFYINGELNVNIGNHSVRIESAFNIGERKPMADLTIKYNEMGDLNGQLVFETDNAIYSTLDVTKQFRELINERVEGLYEFVEGDEDHDWDIPFA